MHFAAIKGRIDIVRWLIDLGAKTDLQNKARLPPRAHSTVFTVI